MIQCELCEYYDSEDDRCTFLDCDMENCDTELPCEREDTDEENR